MYKNNQNRCDVLIALALRKWTRESQTRCIMEELSELSVAVSHADRDRPGWRANLLEEMADVEIVMRELHQMADITEEELDDEVTRKLDKFERQIKEPLDEGIA